MQAGSSGGGHGELVWKLSFEYALRGNHSSRTHGHSRVIPRWWGRSVFRRELECTHRDSLVAESLRACRRPRCRHIARACRRAATRRWQRHAVRRANACQARESQRPRRGDKAGILLRPLTRTSRLRLRAPAPVAAVVVIPFLWPQWSTWLVAYRQLASAPCLSAILCCCPGRKLVVPCPFHAMRQRQ